MINEAKLVLERMQRNTALRQKVLTNIIETAEGQSEINFKGNFIFEYPFSYLVQYADRKTFERVLLGRLGAEQGVLDKTYETLGRETEDSPKKYLEQKVTERKSWIMICYGLLAESLATPYVDRPKSTVESAIKMSNDYQQGYESSRSMKCFNLRES